MQNIHKVCKPLSKTVGGLSKSKLGTKAQFIIAQQQPQTQSPNTRIFFINFYLCCLFYFSNSSKYYCWYSDRENDQSHEISLFMWFLSCIKPLQPILFQMDKISHFFNVSYNLILKFNCTVLSPVFTNYRVFQKEWKFLYDY